MYYSICSSSLLFDISLIVIAAATWTSTAFVKADDPLEETGKLMILSLLIMGPLVLSILVKLLTKKEHKELLAMHGAKEGKRQKQSIFWNFFDHPLPIDRYQTRKEELESFCESLRFPGRTVIFLLVPSLSLFLLCIVRLFLGIKPYSAIPSELDFGFVGGDSSSTEEGFATKNVAFEKDSMMYLVAAQGFASAFVSFPVINGFLSWLVSSWRENRCCARVFCGGIQMIIQLLPWAAAVYPCVLVGFEYFESEFATSELWTELMEWSFSFLIGLGCGRFITEVAICYNVRRILVEQRKADEAKADQTDSDDEEKASADVDEDNEMKHITTPGSPSMVTKFMQMALGFALSAAVVAAAVETADTWTSDEDGALMPYNYIGLLPSLLLFPTIIFLLASVVLRRRSKELATHFSG